MLNRRAVLRSTAAAAFGVPLASRFPLQAQSPENQRRPRIAFLGTIVKQHSHAQHFLDRLAAGYTWQGNWQAPRVEIAGVYIAQIPEGDLSVERIAKYRLRQFPSIAETLTLGGEKLAVDGVVLIGEHGDYPRNELGQTLYPRHAWFKEVVRVFEDSGRAVPLFNDKHLSTDWEECVEMVEDSRRLGFAFLAGSSLPVTRRFPAIDMPLDADLQESVCVGYGGADSYDFHALETAQCMSERRKGGEVGIRSVHALRGEKLWEVLDQPDREVTRRLLVSALTRSHNLPVAGGYPTAPVTYAWVKQTLPQTLGYLIEHLDGFRTTVFMTGIRDFNYAGLIKVAGAERILSCQMYLPMPNHGSTTADFFNPLTRHIEQTMMTRQAPYPVERTLLTSGMVIGGVKSLHAGQTRIETPEMRVAYQAPSASTFWAD